MSLYRHIAAIYDELFPLSTTCLEALETLVPSTEARVHERGLETNKDSASTTAAGPSQPRRVHERGLVTNREPPLAGTQRRVHERGLETNRDSAGTTAARPSQPRRVHERGLVPNRDSAGTTAARPSQPRRVHERGLVTNREPPLAGTQRRVLDLGSATGTLVAALEDRGWEAIGIELDPEMAARARGKVVQGSMLAAEEIVRAERSHANNGRNRGDAVDPGFDAALCLGNTLPHVKPSEYADFFSSVFRLLKSEGVFIIQTLNYAHPSVKPGFVFPPIVAGNVIFNRKYEAGNITGTLTFATDINIEGRHYHDETTLYPVEPEALDVALGHAGFASIRHVSGWNLAEFKPDQDLYLITIATKP